MDESNIVEFAGRDAISDPLTELLRKGARELLQSAVEAELEVFMARFQDRKTPDGHASVVRSRFFRFNLTVVFYTSTFNVKQTTCFTKFMP